LLLFFLFLLPCILVNKDVYIAGKPHRRHHRPIRLHAYRSATTSQAPVDMNIHVANSYHVRRWGSATIQRARAYVNSSCSCTVF